MLSAPAMRTLPILLTVLALIVPLALAADSWPGYRGPSADGRSDAKSLATTWSEKENVRWKTEIHGRGWSSPVVFRDQIWVTTSEEVIDKKNPQPAKGASPENPVKEVSLFAACIDRATGKIAREIKLGVQTNPQYIHPFNSYASCTPYVEAGRVYAHFGSLGTWCIDAATGNVLWERRDLECDHFRGAGSSPVIYGEFLYLIFDGYDLQYVVALDKATGKTAWKTDRNIKYSTANGDNKKAYATPVLFDIDGHSHLICPSAECTIAYNPKTGEELWRIAHGGMNAAARTVMGNGHFYLTAGYPNKLLAVKTNAKPGLGGFLPPSSVTWQTTKDVPSRPSLLLDGKLLYTVSDSAVVSCLEARTGMVYYSERLDGEFSASPVLAGGNIYYCNQNGKTYVVSAGTDYNLVSVNRLDDGFLASPAIAGDALFLRTKTHLYAIGNKK